MRIATPEGATRYLVGRTIVAVDLRPFESGRHRRLHVTTDPVFTLDDGSRLRFFVCETEGTEYGVELIRDSRKDGAS